MMRNNENSNIDKNNFVYFILGYSGKKKLKVIFKCLIQKFLVQCLRYELVCNLILIYLQVVVIILLYCCGMKFLEFVLLFGN